MMLLAWCLLCNNLYVHPKDLSPELVYWNSDWPVPRQAVLSGRPDRILRKAESEELPGDAEETRHDGGHLTVQAKWPHID